MGSFGGAALSYVPEGINKQVMSKHFLCKYVTMNHGFFILKQKTTTSKNHITHLVSGKLGADFASQKTRIACRNVKIFAQTSFHVQVPKNVYRNRLHCYFVYSSS